MEVRKAGELIRGRREAHARLRRRRLAVGLQRDAAEAVGVARRRGGQRSLVAAQERVLGGVAAQLGRADGEVVDEPVAGQGLAGRLDRGVQPAARVPPRLPPAERVGAQRRHPQLVVVLDHRRVAVERQPAAPRQRARRRQQGAQVPDRQHRGHRQQVRLHVDRPVLGIERQRPPAREVHQRRPLGERDRVGQLELEHPAAGPRGRAEATEHLELAVRPRDQGTHGIDSPPAPRRSTPTLPDGRELTDAQRRVRSAYSSLARLCARRAASSMVCSNRTRVG